MVAERLVALAHRLAEAGLHGTLLEGEALRGVACDSVEQGPERLGGVQALCSRATG